MKGLNAKFSGLIKEGKTIEQAYTTMMVKNPAKYLQGCSYDANFTPTRSERLKNVASETDVSYHILTFV